MVRPHGVNLRLFRIDVKGQESSWLMLLGYLELRRPCQERQKWMIPATKTLAPAALATAGAL